MDSRSRVLTSNTPLSEYLSPMMPFMRLIRACALTSFAYMTNLLAGGIEALELMSLQQRIIAVAKPKIKANIVRAENKQVFDF
jgi:hypothetical protein